MDIVPEETKFFLDFIRMLITFDIRGINLAISRPKGQAVQGPSIPQRDQCISPKFWGPPMYTDAI